MVIRRPQFDRAWTVLGRARPSEITPLNTYQLVRYIPGSSLLQSFTCGDVDMDKFARDADRRCKACNIFVLIRDPGQVVVGFFTLSNYLLQSTKALKKKKMGGLSVPIPSTLLGQLGVSVSEQRKGYAKTLISLAMDEAEVAATSYKSVFLVVHARTESLAAGLYEPSEFVRLESGGLTLVAQIS